MSVSTRLRCRCRWPVVWGSRSQTAALWLWHLPGAYDAALSSVPLYWLMQASLLAPTYIFWRAAAETGETFEPILPPSMTSQTSKPVEIGPRQIPEGSGPIAKNLEHSITERIREQLSLKIGDAVFFVAGLPNEFAEFAAPRPNPVRAGVGTSLRFTLARAGVVRLVRGAAQQRAPFVRMADRYAIVFLPVTAAVAAAPGWCPAGPAPPQPARARGPEQASLCRRRGTGQGFYTIQLNRSMAGIAARRSCFTATCLAQKHMVHAAGSTHSTPRTCRLQQWQCRHQRLQQQALDLLHLHRRPRAGAAARRLAGIGGARRAAVHAAQRAGCDQDAVRFQHLLCGPRRRLKQVCS